MAGAVAVPVQVRAFRGDGMLQTFEPFRQGDHVFALISTHYTATSVMDLATGEIVAAEKPNAAGFCPVGFHVPDWWDRHDGTKLPGSMHWHPADDEWPTGDFGFVWGCIWGDDSSWNHETSSAAPPGMASGESSSVSSAVSTWHFTSPWIARASP